MGPGAGWTVSHAACVCVGVMSLGWLQVAFLLTATLLTHPVLGFGFHERQLLILGRHDGKLVLRQKGGKRVVSPH